MSSKKPPTRKLARPKPSATTEVLLEIGTEELPYQFVGPILRTLQQATETLLKEVPLTYGSVRTMGT
nr:glycine--tRNA ligase subunit beta [Nitrospira sp.]